MRRFAAGAAAEEEEDWVGRRKINIFDKTGAQRLGKGWNRRR